MNKYGKINNGVLEYFEQPSNILGDCVDVALAKGYKEVEYRIGDNGIYEEEDKIIVETPKPKRLWVEVLNPYMIGFTTEQIQNTDIDLLQGLTCKRRYSRGYLCEKKYLTEDNKLAIERTYELIYDEGGILIGETSVIKWHYEDGTVAFEKEGVVYFSAKDSASRLREIRQIRIDYLQYPEKEYIKPELLGYIDSLFKRYKDEVLEYIVSGNSAFAEKVKNESDPQFKAILSARLPDGKSVKESILYQIEGE